MPDKFIVPQFLDVETKIIGPITARQFGILMATAVVVFIIYRVFLNLFLLLAFGIPVIFIGVVFAFVKINGQPFHVIVLNMIQTLRKPGLRVWDKQLSETELKEKAKKEVKKPPPPPKRKKRMSRSRLQEVSLVLNTGGMYSPEDQFTSYGKKEE